MKSCLTTIFTLFMTLLVLQLFANTASASPNSITFQSKIYKPDGHLLEASSVNFRFVTLDSFGTCTLYIEDFSAVNMEGSSGLAIFNLGTGTKVFPVAAYTYTKVFNNLQPSYNCQAGGTYSPGLTDRRKIVLQFNDGSAAGWQTLQAVDINSVPYANYAGDSQTLAGKLPSDFLMAASIPDCSTAGKVLTFNGTSFTCVTTGAGAGTVTNVTSANSYLSVATGTTTPVLTANVGTVANTLAAGDDARIIGAAQKANNLSDLASASTARTNLGLGTAAVLNVGTAATNVVQLDGAGKIPAAVLPATSVTTTTSLAGDVTGTIGATVVSTVGTKTAAEVAQSVADTLAATSANTASTIVKRDASGNIAISTVSSLNLSTQNAYLYDATNTNKILLKAPAAGVTDYTFTLPPVIGTANQIIGYNNAGTVLENKSITAGAGVTVTHSAGGIQIAATGSGGTVSSVTSANADIAVATTTTTPILTLNSGTGAGQIVKLDGSAKLPAVDGSALTNLDPTHLSAAVAVNKGGTGATTANAGLNNLLPAQATNSGKVLQTDGTNTSWVLGNSGTVTNVTSANSYLTVATGTTTPVLTAVVGTGANTLAAGDDSRIVNAVQQSAYSSDIANVLDSNCGAGSAPKWNVATDMWTCVAIGSLNASAITAGTIATARLGSGTADATTYLRGDGTWTAPAASQWTTTGSNIYYNTGKVGIGTSTPANDLHVSKSATGAIIRVESTLNSGGGSALLHLARANATANSNVDFLGPTSDWVFGHVGGTNSIILQDVWNAQDIITVEQNATSNRLYMKAGGNVGIGTTNPGATLEVAGTIKITGGTPGVGKVLTSNAVGLASWTAPATSGTVTSVTSANADIGVATGTTTPVLTLNSGTGASQIVKLDGLAKLPAVDGSALTNLDPTHLSAAVAVNKGGTGATTANAGLNNLLPAQATNSGKVLQTDGTNTSWVLGNAGTVTNVTSANSYLTVATGTSTPVLTAVVGTAANTLAAGDDSRIVNAVQQSAYNGDIANVLDSNCAAGSTPKWNVATDMWTCVAIGSLNASAITAGTIATARLGLGTADATTYLRGDGTWTTPQTSQWTTTGSDIYYTTGNVGIGTTVPGYPLDINPGSIRLNPGNINKASFIQAGAPGNGTLDLRATNNGAVAELHLDSDSYISTSFNNSEKFRITSAGNVGVGTTAPTANLDVTGSTASDTKMHVVNTSTGAVGIELRTHGNTIPYIDFAVNSTSDSGSGTPDYGGRIEYNHNNANGFSFSVNGGSTPSMIINSSGNVGIGTTAPGATLDVAGTIKISGGTPGVGKVLTSDAAGLASWTAPATSGTVTSVTSANSYLTVATGTSTPVLTAVVGTAANTLAAGDDSRITGAAQKASNLSDLASAATARTNLGLGGAATLAVGTTAGTVAAGDDSRITGAVQQSAYNGDIANVLDSNCGAGSTPKWNVATDMWTCVAIGSLNASAITAGTMATARLGSGTADATTYLRGDGTWATPGSQWVTTGNDIYYTTGNVGIGTTAPAAGLHVIGTNGSGSSAAPATMTVVGGAGGTNAAGGAISITSGAGNGSGVGGAASLSGGAGGASAAGGAVTIAAGSGQTGGALLLKSGNAWGGVGNASLTLGGAGSVTSGNVTLTSGATGGAAPTNSGSLTIQTASTTTGFTASAGNISITAGSGEAAGTGGSVSISAGAGGATNVNGSNVTINGGAKGGTGTDGNVILAGTRGKVGIGTTSVGAPLTLSSTGAQIYVSQVGTDSVTYAASATTEHNSGGYTPGITSNGNAGDTVANIAVVNSSASGSPMNYGFMGVGARSFWTGGPGPVVSGDYLPGLAFAGLTNSTPGTGTVIGAFLTGIIDNTVTSGNLPTALSFQTSISNHSGLTERLRISSAGNVGIGTTAPGALLDVNGTMRVNQICDSAGSNCKTVSGGWGGGGISTLTAATSADTIDNLNYAQTWNWSTATTQSPMAMSANALTTGSLMSLTSSNASLNSTNGLLYVANTSASTTGTVARFVANSTAGSGLTVLANGNVGIGTASPTTPLTVSGTTTLNGNLVVSGAMTNTASTNANALAAVTADFTSTNLIRSTAAGAACGTLNVTNVGNGSYTLTLLNATTSCSTIQLNGSTTNVKLPSSYSAGAAVSGIVYSFIYDGVTLWVSAVPF